ncbi:hypothetical protein HMPREF1212_04361 [Parabacteroides sp. HGS0025]|uniref:hypothetical protein n=1 Tax=Parabacteroides sp. HGS0025 TaxID=1078087 RepID=UPI0006175C26|nr:hypothetical protein [Parabacteroides sp. HGS0025]KKB46865.1 hypothetical protein HMPREF1212_04361 [Parabacteroides sp. HGS0025]
MKIFVNVKQLGKRRNAVEDKEVLLDAVPGTVAELIVAIVIRQVEEYNERLEQNDLLKYLTDEEIKDRATTGKVSFEFNYNGLPADTEKAVRNALQSFEDGIFRVFLNEEELESSDQIIDLKEEDKLIFIRLTMLAGRMW